MEQWFETAIVTAFWTFTALAAWQDLKWGSIHIGTFIVGGATGILLQAGRFAAVSGALGSWRAVCTPAYAVLQLLGAACVGIFLLSLAYVTQEAVGLGDGFFFLAAGCYLGFIKTVFLFSASLLLCFPVSSFLMVRRIWKGDKAADRGKERLPFLPFGSGVFTFLVTEGRQENGKAFKGKLYRGSSRCDGSDFIWDWYDHYRGRQNP